MQKSLFRVVSQTEPTTINTKNGQTQKSTVVLQKTGDQFADSYVASLIGNQVKFYKGDLVWAALRFAHRNVNVRLYEGDYCSLVHMQNGKYQVHMKHIDASGDIDRNLLAFNIYYELLEAFRIIG